MQNNIFYTDMPDFTDQGTPVCAETDPDLFFSVENYTADGNKIISSRYESEKDAKKICQSCPYINKCLTYALENPELRGIWGGTTERDRYRLRRSIDLNSRIIESDKTR